MEIVLRNFTPTTVRCDQRYPYFEAAFEITDCTSVTLDTTSSSVSFYFPVPYEIVDYVENHTVIRLTEHPAKVLCDWEGSFEVDTYPISVTLESPRQNTVRVLEYHLPELVPPTIRFVYTPSATLSWSQSDQYPTYYYLAISLSSNLLPVHTWVNLTLALECDATSYLYTPLPIEIEVV